MLRDLATKYYEEDDRNCAESILMAANEQYELGLNIEEIKLVSGFGGGMGCGSTCGALAGSIAALGRLMVHEKAHATVGFRNHCGNLVDEFKQRLGGIDCHELMPKYKTAESGCVATVQIAADVFEEHMETIGK